MKNSQDIADDICQAIRQIKTRTPAFDNIFDAFGELIAAKACFQSELPLPVTDHTFEPDPVRFSQGVPVLNGKTPAFDKSWLPKAAESLFPAMEKGFPKAARDIRAVKQAIVNRRISPEIFMRAVLNGEDEKIREICDESEIEPQLLRFVIGQISKPFMEKLAEASKPLIEKLRWDKGYCPICGSNPELGIIRGETGERWLRCAVCSHEWRFMRTRCPVCENDSADNMELIFSEDRPQERAELCHSCEKYLIGFDLRKYPKPIIFDVERLGALYLDVLAQERGYSPIAVNAWNMMD